MQMVSAQTLQRFVPRQKNDATSPMGANGIA